jgi:glycine/serine hydroxymethyltransferase
MATDFTQGRYNVYSGRGPMTELIGRIDDDEFVRSLSSELLFRIDGDNVYTVGSDAKKIGSIVVTEFGRVLVVDAAHVALLAIEPERR